MKAIRRAWRVAVRWMFRVCGGYHRTEHDEIVHRQLCIAEQETAQLRLFKHNTTFHLLDLQRMLNEELEARVRK